MLGALVVNVQEVQTSGYQALRHASHSRGKSTMAAGPQPLSDDALAKKLAEFESIPLFMKSLPSDEADDDALAALQSLAHDGDPDGQSNLLRVLGLYNLIICAKRLLKISKNKGMSISGVNGIARHLVFMHRE
jgi:hypothetical protein